MNETDLHFMPAPAGVAAGDVPALARGQSVCITGVRLDDGRTLHWLEAQHARGWVEATLGRSGERALPAHFAEARALGFVTADAALLALGSQAGVLPRLSWGEAPVFAATGRAAGARPLDLYAILDDVERLAAVLQAGVRTVQLRIKRPAQPDAAWQDRLRGQLARGLALAREHDAELFINDHADVALELDADAIHLGQEDLQALGEAGRTRLMARGTALGISSHSVWELCRARALAPRYIACGPVWPTTTKDMPWLPQRLDNLGWWCRHAGAPVVAIGGILAPQQVAEAARSGADGVCLVRGLGETPAQTLPAFEQALREGRQGVKASSGAALTPQDWPHPSLPSPAAAPRA